MYTRGFVLVLTATTLFGCKRSTSPRTDVTAASASTVPSVSSAGTPPSATASATPPQPVTIANERAFGIALDGGSVFWSTGATVYRRRLREDQPAVVVQAEPGARITALQADANWIYFIEHGAQTSTGTVGSIARVPRTGGAKSVLSDKQANPASLVAANGRVYWTSRTGGSAKGSIFAMDATAKAPRLVASGEMSGWSIAVDDDDVFWTSEKGIDRAPLLGGKPTTVYELFGNTGALMFLSAAGGFLFWQEGRSDDAIQAVSKDGPSMSAAYAVAKTGTVKVSAADRSGLYWYNDTLHSIFTLSVEQAKTSGRSGSRAVPCRLGPARLPVLDEVLVVGDGGVAWSNEQSVVVMSREAVRAATTTCRPEDAKPSFIYTRNPAIDDICDVEGTKGYSFANAKPSDVKASYDCSYLTAGQYCCGGLN